MLEEIIHEVKERIGLGDTLGAVDILFSNEKLYSICESNNILMSKGEFMNYKTCYARGLLTLEEYVVHTKKINQRILEILNRLNITRDHLCTTDLPNGPRVVKFSKKEIIIVTYEDESPIDIIFNTSYVVNNLYVRGGRDKVHYNNGIINMLQYSKHFSFVIRMPHSVVQYKLYVNFSYFSGLISRYMLIRNDKIILEERL